MVYLWSHDGKLVNTLNSHTNDVLALTLVRAGDSEILFAAGRGEGAVDVFFDGNGRSLGLSFQT